jgi:acyl homoserine lactone synthase
MQRIIFNMAGMHRHGTAFYDFLRLRKIFFVDQLGWDIPHDDDVEMDQYDNPQAWYVVVLDDDGEVVGGGRTMPNSARWGLHTFMLNDAVKGRLDSIPTSIMDGVRVASQVWEVTRLVISDALGTHAERSECLSLLLEGIETLLLRHGGSEAISLSPVPMVRAMRSLGYDAERRGEPYLCDDGRKYAVLGIPVRAHMRPGASIGSSAGAVAAARRAPTHRPQPTMVHAPQKD